MHVDAVNDILRGIEGLPVPVQQWKVEPGPDSTGDDAVEVTAVLRDRKSDWSWENRVRLRELIWGAVREKAPAPAPWVYIGFESVSEQAYLKELEEEDRLEQIEDEKRLEAEDRRERLARAGARRGR